MNGRVYDPTLGRFIQADPHIQAPSDSQSLNRYSYVKNNPLSYTDPTGFFFKKLFKGLKKLWNKIRPFVGTILNIIVAIKCFGVCTAGQWAIGAAEAGFMGAAATGGNPIKGALMGAFSSYAFGFIGANFDVGTFGNIVGNGVVGGIMSELQGGNFGHGFIAAGFSAAFKPLVNTIGGDNASGIFARASAAAIIGGTASKLSGGKFANGAITSSMSQLFNGERTRAANKKVRVAKATKEHAKAIDKLRTIAKDVALEYDLNCDSWKCELPWIRGTGIHKLFADRVRRLGVNYDAEVSYKDGIRVPYGTRGSVRADAIYGNPDSPEIVFELKTGFFNYMSNREALNYANNIPLGADPGIALIKVD